MCVSMPGLAGTLRVDGIGATLREPRVAVWLAAKRLAGAVRFPSEIAGDIVIERCVLMGPYDVSTAIFFFVWSREAGHRETLVGSHTPGSAR